jgi:chromosome segregation ATPase
VIKSYQHEVSCHRKAAELHVEEINKLKTWVESLQKNIDGYRVEIGKDQQRLAKQAGTLIDYQNKVENLKRSLEQSEAKLAIARGNSSDYTTKQVQLLQDQLKAAEQKHNDYKRGLLAIGYTDQSAEIRRLKTRLNQLIDRTNMTCDYFKSFVKENL